MSRLWQEVLESARATQRFILPDEIPASELMHAEGLRYLTRLFAAGTRICVELGDPDFPELGRMVDTTLSWGIDNPDCIYLFAAVRGDATYRITGRRGSAHHFDVQINRGHFADAPNFGVISSLNGQDLDVGADGEIEIVVSPEPQPRNWLRSEPGVEFLLLRQYFYDWENEQPADLCIQRDDAVYPPPPLGGAAIAQRLDRLRRWFDSGCNYWEQLAHMSMEQSNTVAFFAPGSADSAGLKGLAYGLGSFRCAEDEAVILEVEPPRCHYWSFSLGNAYWESIDWARRQSSLNGHQAVLDRDGVFRAVIATHDPGVPNWLDNGGHTRGTIMGRYLLTADAPNPAMRVVKLAEVRAALPAETATISAPQRSEALRRRERSVRRRNRQ